MKWLGLICLIIIICYSSYPGRVQKLEGKVKKLERKLSGGDDMSKIIKDLVGKQCILTSQEALFFAGNTEVECMVLAADDEWIKFTYTNKKKVKKTKILRIDSVESIDLLSE